MTGPRDARPVVPTEPPKRSWLPCGCVIVLFLIVFVGPVLAWLAWSVSAAREAEEQLAKIREKGEPTDAQELEKWYHTPPAGADVTQLLIDAITPLEGAGFDTAIQGLPIVATDDNVPPANQAWEELEAVEELLALYKESMDKLHEIGETGGETRFDHQFSEGFAMLLPHVQLARSGARMLALEAHVRAHRGDASGVVESVSSMVALARTLEGEPLVISQLVSVAIYGVATDTLNRTLPYIQPSDADLVTLRETFGTNRFAESTYRAAVGERAMGIHAFQNPSQVMDVDSRLPVRASNEDLTLYLKYMSDLADAATQPMPESLDATDKAEADLNATVESSPLGRVRYPLTLMAAPAQGTAFKAMAGGIAQSAMVDTAIAIEQYRRATGAPPKTLEELVPTYLSQVPRDPLDGQPLRYVLTDEDYMLYSVGRNRSDDGGTKQDALDIVFRVPLSPAAKPPASSPAE